jgi:hypothetical protein
MKAPAPIGSAACARTGRGARARRQSDRVRACLVILALAAGSGWAQEAEEVSELDRVLAMHHEARGGLEKLRAIQSVRATGTMLVQGMDAPFTIHLRRPNQTRVEGDFGGMALIQAFDGQQAWSQQPGQPKPAALEGDVAAAQAADAALSSPWFEYTELGYEVELAGREEIESGEAWKLVVTAPGGVAHQVFIGTEDGLEKKRISRADFGFGLEDSETRFEDYRDVDGLMLAHRQILVSSMGEMPLSLDSFEINPEIDPDIFFMPGQMADASLGLDEVVSRYRNTRGASAADVQTLRAGGTIVMAGFEVPMTVAFARPESLRVDIDMQGLTMIIAYDGETAWNVSPMQGVIEPTPLPRETIGALGILSDFMWGRLADSGESGFEASLAGIEKVERDEAYRLDVTTADGEARALYLGGEDFLERRVVFEGSFLGSTGEIEVTIGDYTDAGGLMVPGKIRIAVEGLVVTELRIQEAEAGAEIDPASFTMPAPANPETPGPAL